jgi:site-specific DNA-methyltransferase (adenine-specific)
MKNIPDKSVDMILTSPPYDNLRTYNGYTFDFEGIAKEIYRVLKDGGVWRELNCGGHGYLTLKMAGKT